MPFRVTKHNIIAQIIFEKNGLPCIEHVNELDKTNQGTRGFGSTSKRCTAFRVNDQQVMIMQQTKNKIKAHLATIPTVSQDPADDSHTTPNQRGTGTEPRSKKSAHPTNQGGGNSTNQMQNQPNKTFVVELDDNKDTPETEYLQQQIHPIPPDG